MITTYLDYNTQCTLIPNHQLYRRRYVQMNFNIRRIAVLHTWGEIRRLWLVLLLPLQKQQALNGRHKNGMDGGSSNLIT